MSLTRWMRWMFFFPWLVLVLAGLLCSCTLLGSQKGDEQGLLLAADRFNKDLRWEDYKSASAYLAPSAKEEFWDQVDRLQGRVRIMNYQVMEAALADDGRSGNVTLRYRFYYKNNPQLQTRTLHQQWLFSEENRSWQVVGYDLQKLTPE